MSKNNLGYETSRIMFVKMTAKSKFSPRSFQNGAIGRNTLYSFSSSGLNFHRAKLAVKILYTHSIVLSLELFICQAGDSHSTRARPC